MEDDEQFVSFETEEVCYSRRFLRADVFVLGLQLVAGVANAVSSTCETAMTLAGAHANWKQDQDSFHEEAALEIESLVSGDYEEEEGEE